MRLSSEGLKLIQAWEGIKDGNPATVLLEPYICPANVYTVGWGHALKTPSGANIDVDVFGAAKSARLAAEAMDRSYGRPGITREEAVELLDRDADHFSRDVTKLIGEGNATQSQFDALVSFAFNCGVGNFDGSSVKRLHLSGHRKIGDVSLSKLYLSSRNKEPPTYMALAFARWANSNGKWTLGLYKRRVSELMVYGGHPVNIAIATGQGFKAD